MNTILCVILLAVHNVLDYGANPDGKTLCTAAIQKAIDAGGTVRFPPGTYLSGALRLKSGVTLQLDEGATLLGSRNAQDYAGAPGLIHGDGLHDIAIKGKGTIDGNGDAFRDKDKKRPRNIHLEKCRNVLVEGLRLRNSGSWMQHYRLCENVTLRDLDVNNHVSFNNDGLDIDSCRDVTITRCRVDSDDDAIVLKSLSTEPCRNVRITDCIISSHCNALKMGTESGGGFVDMTISNCTVSSPQHSKKIYGDQRGLAGIALEIVDGGRMENVTVTDVKISGVLAPIFLRLGNRARQYGRSEKPGVGTLRGVRLRNITGTAVSALGCAIAGLPGHPIEDVTLENVALSFDGGGDATNSVRQIPERPDAYPECKMFGQLPAFGFYCRHVKGLRFSNLTLRTVAADLRPALVFDDVQELTINGLDAVRWPGGAESVTHRK
jgi:polygalacturonase